MKKNSLIIAALFLLFSTVFVSCSKDEEKTGGKFKYDNETYELGQGEILYYGEIEPNVHMLDIILFSSGVKVDDTGEPISGVGDYVAFEVLSSSATELNESTYMSAGVSEVGSIEYGMFMVNADIPNQTYDFVRFMSDATIDVEKDGDRYNLDFYGTDAEGVNVTGDYSGKLRYYVDEYGKSDKKSFFRSRKK